MQEFNNEFWAYNGQLCMEVNPTKYSRKTFLLSALNPPTNVGCVARAF